jgi:predicted RNA-binding protein YlxR (DUF448 family)
LAADDEALQLDESDSGPRDSKPGRTRLCIATRTVRPIDEMVRFVVAPDNSIVPDVRRRLPGRGVWVTATAEAVNQAVARNAFTRSLKRPVRASAELAAETARLLEKSTLDSLAIAHKASLAVFGFAKVEATLERGQAVALIHASDAAADGVRKLDAVARRIQADNPPVKVTAFSGVQLDLAFGRPNVIHAALLAGPASAAFLARFRVQAAFQGSEAAGEPAKERA